VRSSADESIAHNGSAAILEMPVSDRGTFEGLTQFGLLGSAAMQVVDSKRRDGRVVEGARLESEAGEGHQATPKHLIAQSR